MPPQNTNNHYTITLLRHGLSEGNANEIIQGQADYPLTDIGIAQAEALAQRWENERRQFDSIISSPQQRALQTAEIIAARLKLQVEPDPLWMERHVGQLTGLTMEQAEKLHPRPPFLPLFQPFAGTGESLFALYLRAGQAVESLLRRPPGKYLVVSHGGILNRVLYIMLGIPPQPNFQGARFRFRNTSFANLRFDPERHEWLLERLNDREHWNGHDDW